MKDGLRQSMAWLHTWSGLLVCWVLFLIFVCGTASYYRDEISYWMKPELHAAAAPAKSPDAVAAQAARAVRALQERAPDAVRWVIDLPGERNPVIAASWNTPPVKGESRESRRARLRQQSMHLHPVTGEEIQKPRDTRGGEFLYRLHFDLHYMPAIWGRWVVGICAMFMLVAIVSGVITHKRIFKDFFTFRPGKGQRSWLDAHNVTAVLALPFHLMITYTGLVTLMFLYMPAPAKLLYGDDDKTFIAEVFPTPPRAAKPSGIPAPLADLEPMLARAMRDWDGEQPDRIVVQNPGQSNAVVSLTRKPGSQLSNYEPSLSFHGFSGEPMPDGEHVSSASTARRAFYGMHLAHFASPLLRALFFLSGLAGCAMVATGALLWAVKTRQQQAKDIAKGARARLSPGLRLVDGMNIGVIAGLPAALAAYFWANRLLPAGMADRAGAEASTFFAAWALALLLAHIAPCRAMWRVQLAAVAFLFGAIPLLNLLTVGAYAGLPGGLAGGTGIVAGFDLVMVLLGAAFGYAAWKLGRQDRAARRSAGVAACAAALRERAQ